MSPRLLSCSLILTKWQRTRCSDMQILKSLSCKTWQHYLYSIKETGKSAVILSISPHLSRCRCCSENGVKPCIFLELVHSTTLISHFRLANVMILVWFHLCYLFIPEQECFLARRRKKAKMFSRLCHNNKPQIHCSRSCMREMLTSQ